LRSAKTEDFHEFLRAYADIFANNVYSAKDFAYLKHLVENKDIIVAAGNKDSSVVIMDRQDYNNKLQEMIDDGIRCL